MDMLKDQGGKTSTMRIMSIMSLFAAIFFAYPTIILESHDGVMIVFSFLLGAFAPKALQKFAENQTKPAKE